MHGHLNVKKATNLLPLWAFVVCSNMNFALTFTLPFETNLTYSSPSEFKCASVEKLQVTQWVSQIVLTFSACILPDHKFLYAQRAV